DGDLASVDELTQDGGELRRCQPSIVDGETFPVTQQIDCYLSVDRRRRSGGGATGVASRIEAVPGVSGEQARPGEGQRFVVPQRTRVRRIVSPVLPRRRGSVR